jgi:hypothetical protein
MKMKLLGLMIWVTRQRGKVIVRRNINVNENAKSAKNELILPSA